MPTFRTTFMIESLGAGWSETWQGDYSTLALAEAAADQYGEARRQVLCVGAPDTAPNEIVGFRIQQQDEPLNYIVRRRDWPGTYKPEIVEGPDMPWTGVLCSILSLSGRRRSFLLRGVDDSAIRGSYKSVAFSATFRKALDFWSSRLISVGYGLAVFDTGAGNPLHDIATLVPGNGFLTLTTALPHGLATNNRIRFDNVRASVPITGTHSVIVVDETTIKVLGFNLNTINFQSGSYRKEVSTLSDIVGVEYVRKGSRKPGRPFFLLRGRK